MRWFKALAGRLARSRTSHAATAQAMKQAWRLADEGRHKESLAIWGPLAQAGHSRAQNNVGACFSQGLGVARDPALAIKWLSLAAAGGDPVGRRNLASAFLAGEGVAADPARAKELYRLAAEQGDASAQDRLSGLLLDAGKNEEARRWALAAARQGVATAMTRIGMIHHEARGVARDPAAAVDWWRRAAELGEADAQAMLGAALHLGLGCARDDASALAWLTRAEAGGSLLAARFIGPAREALASDGGRSGSPRTDSARSDSAPSDPAR